MSDPITPYEMGDPWKTLIDGEPSDPWPYERGGEVAGEIQFRSFPRRGRFSWAGFFRHPSVVGACVSVILCCLIVAGLIVARFVEVMR